MVDDVDAGEVRSDPEECDVLWEWRRGSHTGPGADASPNQGSEMSNLGVPSFRHRESGGAQGSGTESLLGGAGLNVSLGFCREALCPDVMGRGAGPTLGLTHKRGGG